MTLDVRRFMHTLSKHGGPQYTNRFQVRLPVINLPLIEKALGYEDANGSELNVLCKSVRVPGFDLEMKAERKHGSRAPLAHATGFQVSETQLVFTDTANGLIRTYFENWFDSIVDDHGRVAYYSDSVRDIHVDTLDKEGNVTMSTRLMDCFPKTRLSYDLSNASADTPLELTVTLQVANYEMKTGTEAKVNKAIGKITKANRFIRDITDIDIGASIGNSVRRLF